MFLNNQLLKMKSHHEQQRPKPFFNSKLCKSFHLEVCLWSTNDYLMGLFDIFSFSWYKII